MDDRIRKIRLCVYLVSFVVKRIRLRFSLCTCIFLYVNLDFLTLTQHNNSYDGHNGNRTSTMLRERLHISLAKQIESVSTTLNPEKVQIKTFTELDRSYIAEIRVLPKEDVSGST